MTGRRLVWLATVLTAASSFATELVAPDAAHALVGRQHEGISSLEVAPKTGRLWATWYCSPGPGENHQNYCVLSTSEDGGETWKEVLVADPDGDGLTRAFDPELWIAPDGKLRWTWCERALDPKATDLKNPWNGYSNLASDALMCVTLDPDAEPVVPFPTPVRLMQGVMMCKPTVLKDGRWLYPLSHWAAPTSSVFYATRDGVRFERVGGASLPKPDRLFDEEQVVEHRDGRLHAHIRTRESLAESFSSDGGRTWTAPTNSPLGHVSARIFVRRLHSGNILLVKHGAIGETPKNRCRLMAFLSRDDGRTWEGGLMLDERSGVSYPDGCQAPDGTIHVTYDYGRTSCRRIYFASFTEADVLAGKDASGKLRLRRVISERPATDHLVTAEMSLEDVMKLDVKPGERVLFARGGIWRGTLTLKGGTAEKPVVYGAFGEGSAPILTASLDASRAADWTPAGDGLWKLAVSNELDVGAMWFGGEKAVGFKKDTLADVRDDLDFHCDRKTRTTLLKSAKNPAERFKSVELSLGAHGLQIRGANGIVLDELHVRGAGNHGLSACSAKNVTIRNCTFDRIGGAELYVSSFGKHVRFGNAIEFWGDAENVLVESNRFDQVWDAALTHQCSGKAENRNIVWRGNRVSRCEYSYEYWQQAPGSVTENVLVEGNVFEDAGGGFGHVQRWNPNAAHLVIQDTTAATKNFVIRNNVFGASKDRGIRLFNDWHGAFRLENNVWKLTTGSVFCQYHARPNANAELKELFPDYADQRHEDDIRFIERNSRGAAVYRETPEDVARFLRDFGLKSR